MSILSDSELLLNHIKNSFIFGDDTGICELIIEKEFPSQINIHDILNDNVNYPIIDVTSQMFRSSSPDIPLTSTRMSTRKLSSEVRIKEVELNDSRYPVGHRFINSGELPRHLTDDDVKEFFEIFDKSTFTKSSTSLLSKLLEQTEKTDIASVNIFSQYSRFSAIRYTKSFQPSSKKVIFNEIVVCDEESNKSLRDFNIYFWDYEEQQNRSDPVKVRPILETKVVDLIGLACWKYVEENRNPPLSNASIVSKLHLFMFEDIDDLDLGFGSLNGIDPIYKYQFTNLAIMEYSRKGRRNIVSVSSMASESSFVTQSHMEKMGLRPKSITEINSLPDRHSISNSSDVADGSILVQIQLAHGLSKIRFASDTTVGQVIQHTINKRQLLQHGEHYKYKLELVSEPGKELDTDLTLNQIESSSFLLVRDMSRRKPAVADLINEDASNSFSKIMDSLQKKTYNVYLKQSLKRWECVLSICQDMIEIESIVKLPFIIKPRTVRIPITFLADCTINYHGRSQQDSYDKVTIKLIHLKSKSALVKSSRASVDFELSTVDSETSSNKSQSRYELRSVPFDAMPNNLLTELTSHSISCLSPMGRMIYDQITSIMDFKGHLIRKEYLNLSR